MTFQKALNSLKLSLGQLLRPATPTQPSVGLAPQADSLGFWGAAWRGARLPFEVRNRSML